MAKANKASLDAKAYINGQINEMREKFSKAHDGETRQQLIENFNELTSSDEYQENLAVVQEDTDTIRKYARRKKGGDITPEEFDAAKTEFYGKNTNLNFSKSEHEKRLKYIVENSFGILNVGKMEGKFSQKETEYILNNIEYDNILKSSVLMSLYLNYMKFTFKGKNSFDGMVDFIYNKIPENYIDSNNTLKNGVIELINRKKGKSHDTYKLTPKNIKLVKVLKILAPCTTSECDRIVDNLIMISNYSVLEWFVKNYTKGVICSKIVKYGGSLTPEQQAKTGISNDKLSKALRYLEEKK